MDRTTDLGLAVFLEINGYEIFDINTQNPHLSIFLFKNPPELESIINLFYEGKALVDPLKFLTGIKNLKSRIGEKKR